jgi:hypothetical protein
MRPPIAQRRRGAVLIAAVCRGTAASLSACGPSSKTTGSTGSSASTCTACTEDVPSAEAAQALKHANVGKTATITSADILNGLYKMDGNTLGGLAPPLNFSPTSTGQKINCWFTMAIQNQAFTAPDGLKLSCYNGPVSS